MCYSHYTLNHAQAVFGKKFARDLCRRMPAACGFGGSWGSRYPTLFVDFISDHPDIGMRNLLIGRLRIARNRHLAMKE